MKLQQAYVSESNVAGGWTLIGYTGPGTSATGGNGTSTYTTNFNYSSSMAGTATAGTGTTSSAWKAMPKSKLNDCTTADSWNVAITVVEGGTISFAATISETTAGTCNSLTPTFTKISQGS